MQQPELPAPLAAFRHKLARLVEITARAPEPVDGVGYSAETRAAINKEYRTVLRWFDDAAAQLPATQRSATEREQ